MTAREWLFIAPAIIAPIIMVAATVLDGWSKGWAETWPANRALLMLSPLVGVGASLAAVICLKIVWFMSVVVAGVAQIIITIAGFILGDAL